MSGHFLIVSGGRRFAYAPDHATPEARHKADSERRALRDALDELDPSAVYDGGATGADAVARAWRYDMGAGGISDPVTNAEWDLFKKAAGPRRNARLLARALADSEAAKVPLEALLTPGGYGTADMRRKLEAKRIKIYELADVLADVLAKKVK